MISRSTWIALFFFPFTSPFSSSSSSLLFIFPDDIFRLYYYHFNHGNLINHCTVCSQNVHITVAYLNDHVQCFIFTFQTSSNEAEKEQNMYIRLSNTYLKKINRYRKKSKIQLKKIHTFYKLIPRLPPPCRLIIQIYSFLKTPHYHRHHQKNVFRSLSFV